jgi:hypothetical protein
VPYSWRGIPMRSHLRLRGMAIRMPNSDRALGGVRARTPTAGCDSRFGELPAQWIAQQGLAQVPQFFVDLIGTR